MENLRIFLTFFKIALDARTAPGHIAYGYIGYMLKLIQQKRICGEKPFSFSCRCSGIGRKVLPLALFAALFLSPSYLLINCQKKDSSGDSSKKNNPISPLCPSKFTIKHSFGLPDEGSDVGPALPDAVEASSTGATLFNIRETIEKKAELGEIDVNTKNMKFALLTEAAGLFEIDADDNLTIKEQNSFLSAMQEGRTEFLLTLDGSVGRHCFTLFVDYLPVASDFFVSQSLRYELPYHIRVAKPEEIQFGGGALPQNYIGSVVAVSDGVDTSLEFEITKAIPAGWEGLFRIDSQKGILSITDDSASVDSHFNILDRKDAKGEDLLSGLAAFYERSDLPLPADRKFVLTVKVSQKTSEGVIIESKSTDVELAMPAFGPEDCSSLEFEETPVSITALEAQTLKKQYCTHLDYEIRPRGIEFISTQADLDALPDGLSQAKQNYQIIFRDEFSNEGGPEVLDPRLWNVVNAKECSHIESKDGFLHLQLTKNCPQRIFFNATLQYKYGYMEVAFRRLPNGNSDNAGNFLFNSYVRGFPISDRVRSELWCGGADIARKRRLWLSTEGTEMQYLELNTITLPGADSGVGYAWWVFHLRRRGKAEACDTDGYIPSGVYWDSFYFGNNSFSGDDIFRIAVEWTPSGYRGFLNGETYVSQNSAYQEYGYRVNSTVYTIVPTPGSNLIGSTVSHAYQSIKIFMSSYPKFNGSLLSEDWEINAEIDYIRVYQPKDKYAGETKVYD